MKRANVQKPVFSIKYSVFSIQYSVASHKIRANGQRLIAKCPKSGVMKNFKKFHKAFLRNIKNDFGFKEILLY